MTRPRLTRAQLRELAALEYMDRWTYNQFPPRALVPARPYSAAAIALLRHGYASQVHGGLIITGSGIRRLVRAMSAGFSESAWLGHIWAGHPDESLPHRYPIRTRPLPDVAAKDA